MLWIINNLFFVVIVVVNIYYFLFKIFKLKGNWFQKSTGSHNTHIFFYGHELY